MDTGSASSLFSFQVIIAVIYLVTVIVVCMVIIFENRAPVKTLSWVLVITLLPVAGIILYFFFGQNYRKKKIFSRKRLADSDHLLNAAFEQTRSVSELLSRKGKNFLEKQQLVTLMLNNEKSVLTANNSIELANDPEQIYNSMISDIESAEDHVHLEVYRFDIDDTGNRFREALRKKAGEGVEVRVIIDDVGSWSFKKRYIDKDRRDGVQVFPFFPVRFPWFASKLNYRNHRKILVVDGQVGYIGGMNIADKYVKGLPGTGPWADTHLRIRGDSVAGLNRVFLNDWYFLSGEVLTGKKKYFPHPKSGGDSLVQLASSGPDSNWATIMQAYFSAIATAKKYVYICTPYFSPNESILNSLKTAALSGLDVRIIMPGKSDSAIATWNSRSYVAELLNAGVRVYLFNRGFNHSKYFIVDDILSSVGSVNVDMRSFDMNFEVTALIYDEDFSVKLKKLFFIDAEQSNEVLDDFWTDRPHIDRYRESLARIFGLLY
ncbi:MAG: cardiolipin synthase [Bacteroidales bacterium]|nr:cardiolipin synthase [Bacteroidales bacterium]